MDRLIIRDGEAPRGHHLGQGVPHRVRPRGLAHRRPAGGRGARGTLGRPPSLRVVLERATGEAGHQPRGDREAAPGRAGHLRRVGPSEHVVAAVPRRGRTHARKCRSVRAPAPVAPSVPPPKPRRRSRLPTQLPTRCRLRSSPPRRATGTSRRPVRHPHPTRWSTRPRMTRTPRSSPAARRRSTTSSTGWRSWLTARPAWPPWRDRWGRWSCSWPCSPRGRRSLPVWQVWTARG